MFSTGEPVEEWQMANLDWLAGEVGSAYMPPPTLEFIA